jgi:hypothetical protein
LRGALRDLRFDVARSTIQRNLRDNGIEPAPRRGKALSWSAFLRAHWGAIAAADFFSVEVLAVGGLVRYFVFFVIDLKTRRARVAGVSNSPDGAWMAQVARNLTDAESGSLKDARHLVVDTDPLYTAHFQGRCSRTGACAFSSEGRTTDRSVGRREGPIPTLVPTPAQTRRGQSRGSKGVSQ